MNSIIIRIEVIINVIIYFVGYVSPFDFSQESYMVVVFDGVEIKSHTYSKARDAMDAKRVFIKCGFSVEVTVINNVFNEQLFSIGVCTTMCMYTITLTWYVVQLVVCMCVLLFVIIHE